jgi:activating signal cointegrator 1 complex subunit 2
VEELKPGSLSDRIKMFEAKTCAAPVIPMPETRTYDESAGEDTFVPSVEVPKPVSIAQRKAQLEKQVSQNPSPSKPAIPCKQQQVPQPPQRANQSVQPQQAQTKPPGKLSIPSSVPGQLSLEEMLQKKLAQGARQPPVASSDPVSQPSLPNRPSPAEPAMSYKKSQSTYQESQLAKQSLPQPLPPVQPFSSQLAQSTKSSHQEELQQPQRPQPHHALVIPPPVPGQLSLEEMLQKKQSHIVTTMHEEYQESTQSTTVNYVTPQPPSTQPPVEPSRPVITFTDRALQDSTNECLFTTSGVLLAILTKEDVKKVFASDAPLAISGTSDAIVCIYKDQTCVYHYSPESKDYQLLVGSSIPMHPRYL